MDYTYCLGARNEKAHCNSGEDLPLRFTVGCVGILSTHPSESGFHPSVSVGLSPGSLGDKRREGNMEHFQGRLQLTYLNSVSGLLSSET